jgi:arylsulfatase A-like enzyme
VGALHGAATACLLAWRFRDSILTPPAVGQVQLFDPASKLMGLAPASPLDLLHGFYGLGIFSKAPLVLELLVVNLLLGALLGLIVGTVIRVVPSIGSARRRAWTFAAGFLALSASLHVAMLIPMVVDPQRPRPLTFLIAQVGRRMIADGPLANLMLTAAALAIGMWVWRRVSSLRTLQLQLAATALGIGAIVLIGSVPASHQALAAKRLTPGRDAGARARNVILISIDSLRADHLGCYGYHRQTSPILDRLATDGVRFAAAYSASSWTLPSHATMFTGRYPLSHGTVLRHHRLSAGLPTVPGMLRNAGYMTAGFVSFEYLRRRYGFHQGFDYYDDFSTDFDTVEEEQSRTTGPLLNRQIIPWIEENADGPFFLFVHYFDVHYNYDPPRPYDTMFDPDYEGPDLRQFTKNPAIHPGMPQRQLEHLIALYDGEIRHTDAVVGAVIATVDRLGLGDDTLVIVTADHGDEFFEHGNKGHGTTLYEEVVRVPLLMRWPKGLEAGRVVETPVSLVDLAPTIFDFTGVAPPDGMEGRSLAALLPNDGRDRADGTPVYAHLHTRKRPLIWAMVRSGGDKYLQNLHAPESELYDLRVDPGEQHQRADATTAASLATPLASWLSQQWNAARRLPAAERHIVVDDHNIERLRALGYVD